MIEKNNGILYLENANEHVFVYYRMLRVFGVKKNKPQLNKKADQYQLSSPYDQGRDPRLLGSVIDKFVYEHQWLINLAQADVIVFWEIIVGEYTAAHSYPISVENGLLLVRCDSTGWAHNLRKMKNIYLSAIAERYPDAMIQSIRFIGPDVPSWKHGTRTVLGRGARDTYG